MLAQDFGSRRTHAIASALERSDKEYKDFASEPDLRGEVAATSV
jgi:hypothetical protein